LHRPYASMNWIRFNGSLRALAVSQPLAGTPLVNAAIKNLMAPNVKLAVGCAKRGRWWNHNCVGRQAMSPEINRTTYDNVMFLNVTQKLRDNASS